MENSTSTHQVGPSPGLSVALDKQIERKISTDDARKESTQKPQGVPPTSPVVLNDSSLRGEVVNLIA